MRTAFVLMTALPPTKGHLHLAQFASRVGDLATIVICSQPSEPYALERWAALRRAVSPLRNVELINVHRELEQNPEAPGFWEMWQKIMLEVGVTASDIIVSSEPYGRVLAELTGAEFIIYDPHRELYPCKATEVRKDSRENFHDILPEFQPFLRQTVTLFGAESIGKTTLAKELSKRYDGHFLFEWARPYLEEAGPEITDKAMRDIWLGQKATQEHAWYFEDKPWVFQDTDLFSTVGYWGFWSPDTMPSGLVRDAKRLKSNLYIMLKSNIPFEEDPIRYGGDHREADDTYWEGVLKEHELPYVIIQADTLEERIAEVEKVLDNHWTTMVESLHQFDRHGY